MQDIKKWFFISSALLASVACDAQEDAPGALESVEHDVPMYQAAVTRTELATNFAAAGSRVTDLKYTVRMPDRPERHFRARLTVHAVRGADDAELIVAEDGSPQVDTYVLNDDEGTVTIKSGGATAQVALTPDNAILVNGEEQADEDAAAATLVATPAVEGISAESLVVADAELAEAPAKGVVKKAAKWAWHKIVGRTITIMWGKF